MVRAGTTRRVCKQFITRAKSLHINSHLFHLILTNSRIYLVGEKKSERPIVNQTRSYRLRPPLSCKVVGWGRLHWTLSKHRCLCRLQAKCVHMCGIKEFVTIHDSDDEILFFTLHDCRRGKESFIVEDEAMIRKREIGRQLRDMVCSN